MPAFDTFVRLTAASELRPSHSIQYSQIRPKIFRPAQRQHNRRKSTPNIYGIWRKTDRNSSVPFNAAGISLEEAIAKAGGLVRHQIGGVPLEI